MANGDFLRRRREKLEMSMEEVSQKIGVTTTRLSHLENDKVKEPSPKLLKALAALYQLDIFDLFCQYGYLDKTMLNMHQNFMRVEQLSAEDREYIQKQIDYCIYLHEKENEGNLIMNFRMGELFCGPGGIAEGARKAKVEGYRITHAWANDYDENTCATYRTNICPNDPQSVIHGDVRKLDLSSLGQIDALAFGFPCNDFSVVGEQKGMDGVYGPLYSYGVKVLNLYHPQWFLAENVGGLRNANDGKAFDRILSDMKSAGYKLTPHLYKFEEYGVPQARHRIIIIGIRDDLDVTFRVPSPTPYSAIDNTCRTAIEVPPIPKDAPNNEHTKQSPIVVERLKHIKPGQNAFTADLPEELQLHVSGAKISQIYKRLDPTKPAYTVTGSGGGGTHIYHWSEPRALTNRERARLQTFPDTYVFVGGRESVRKQIGMAVPCRGAQIIFEAVLKSFAGIPYEYIEPNINE